MQTKKTLEDQFGTLGSVRFEETLSGLVRVVVETGQAEAVVYLQGAHVAQWMPQGERPVLFTSSRSEFAPGKTIRGGVPIIFPWFGPRGGGLAGASHGFVRTAPWRLEQVHEGEGTVALTLALDSKDVPDSFGYADFGLRFMVVIGAQLEMQLQVRNDSEQPLTYEEALHSYFAVGGIEQVAVAGLTGTTYIDKTDGFKRKVADGDTIRLTKETDQVHLNTPATCVIEDTAWRRRIVVEKSGSETTVVWNPWADKTRELKDMAPDEWRAMICVESANAGGNAVTLAPGEAHVMRVLVRVE